LTSLDRLTDRDKCFQLMHRSDDFTVPGPGTVIVSFDMFVNDADGGPIIDPIGLDHTGPANQHARVDIMADGSAPFDTGAGVVSALYIGVDSQATKPNPYTSYVFDITDAVMPGESYNIRFAETDNQLFLNRGIDNVQIDFTAVPEPGAGAMIVFGVVIGFVAIRRGRK
ncbi:MAG: PEP-CTERM sorting domain-containing protein, partial [Planctomycetota bacterium]